MTEENGKQDDEINLIELFAVLWRRKIMIILITLIAAIAVIIYSVISLRLPPEESFLPNQYTPRALMLIAGSSGARNASSMMGDSMVNLASLVGVSIPVSTSLSELAIYMIGTNSMLDSVVDEFDLITRFNLTESSSPRTISRRTLKNSLRAEYNEKSGVLSISFTHIDPVFARDVVNYCTFYLEKRFDELGLDKNKIMKENLEVNIANTFQEIIMLEEENRRLERSVVTASSFGGVPAITTEINRINMELRAQELIYTQLKVQYESLKVEMASELPLFQILEMAEVPDMKSGPSRTNLCVIVTLAAGFFAVLLAFILNALSNVKNDPEAMQKLRGKSEK